MLERIYAIVEMENSEESCNYRMAKSTHTAY